jgi:beta-lactamase regulating signal transducer with metallopeptidase domain
MIWWIAQNVVVTSLLAGCVWTICRVERIGPAGKHALWLVLLLKLVMPPLVNWPWAIHDLIAPFNTPAATAQTEAPATYAKPDTGAGLPAAVRSAAFVPTPVRKAETPRTLSVSEWLLPAMASIWLIGFAVFAFIQIRRIRCMARLLRIAVPAEPELTSLVGEVAIRLKVSAVDTRIVAGIASPFIWCVYRPVLLWPAALSSKMSKESIRALLVHELAHLKRRDHVVGWLELVAGLLWWWNPVYWYIRHQLRENAELACDAWAVQSVDANPTGRYAYAEALLSVCESIAGDSRKSNPMPVVGVDTGNRRFLERRLTMIVRERLPFRLSRPGILMMALIALTVFPVWNLKVSPATVAKVAAVPQADPMPLQLPPAVGVAESRSTRTIPELTGEIQQARQVEKEILPFTIVAAGTELQVEPKESTARFLQENGFGVPSNDGTAKATLDRHVGVNFSNTPLRQALDALRDLADANLYVPWKALKSIGIEESTPINLKLRDVPLRRALGLVLADATGDNRLTYHVEDGVIEVTTREVAAMFPLERAFAEPWVGNARFGLGRTITWETPTFLPEAQILALRARVGASIDLEVTGELSGIVWGDGIYTDDSAVAAAAVHAGLLKSGETGIIRVISMPGMSQYEGSSRNGVRSDSFDEWGGSYRLERVK